jgi:hypothetical protein
MSLSYAPLVTRAHDVQTQSPLEQQIFRALAWYREGHWEPNPTTRFLDLFVGFEHLLVAGKGQKKADMPAKAPPLLVSWGFARGDVARRLQSQADAARALRTVAVSGGALETELDADVGFQGWRDNDRPFLVLSALERLEARLTTNLPVGDPTRASVTAYVGEFRRFRASMTRLDSVHRGRRARWQFRLELLNLRRNEIAHEALAVRPDMRLHATAMEEALVAALEHLISLVLNLPAIKTVDEALAWYVSPWLE